MEEAPPDGPAGEEAPLFAATLHPHRSLSAAGRLVLILAFGAACFLSGLFFWRLGAWPVSGFFGLDAVLLALALHLNTRAGRAWEEVVLTRDTLLVRAFAPSGRMLREVRIAPAWARLDVTQLPDEGVTRLAVGARGTRVEIGAFLNPDDRDSLARALGNALRSAKGA